MEFGIISIILGVVLAAGIIFYKRPNPEETHQDPIHSAYRRGMEILSPILKWGVPIFLIASGTYYFISLNKEARIKKEAKEKQEQFEKEEKERAIARQIHFHNLLEILDAPMNEREVKVLALDFDPKGTNDFGRKYERDLDETIELFENGTVRFLHKSKESYLRVFNEAKIDSFKFQNESSNNVGDKFSNYSKGSYSSSFGYFTNKETYFCALSDNSKIIDVQDFLPIEFLVGSWGRVSSFNEGKYILNKDKTFTFYDSYYGSITGKWNTENKNIILNYDKKTRQYNIPHSLSMKTEIIHVTNKLHNSIEGYLDHEFKTVTLSRQ